MKRTVLTMFSIASLLLGQTAIAEDMYISQSSEATSDSESFSSTISSENNLIDSSDSSTENLLSTDQKMKESTSETISSSSQESTTNSSTTVSESQSSQASEKTARSTEATVTSWTEFVNALADTSITKMTVTKDLLATSNATVNRTVVIDFGNHVVDFSTYSILVGDAADVQVSNLMFTSTAIAFKGSKTNGLTLGKIQLTGLISAQATNTGALLSMLGGTAVFSAAEFVYSNKSTDLTKIKYGIDVKNLTFTNGTKVASTSPRFVTTDRDADSGGIYTINGGSTITTTNSFGTGDTSGRIWYLKYPVEFLIQGEGTKLTIESNHAAGRVEGVGAFAIGESGTLAASKNAKLTVTDNAEMTITTENSTAMYLNGEGSSIEVSRKGSLVVHQKNDPVNSTNETVRLGSTNNKKFSVVDEGIFRVTKDNGPNAALYISGTNNTVSVENGADFIVKQLEPNPTSSNDDAHGQAVIFRSSLTTLTNTFTASGTNANIELFSAGGGVIQQNTNNGPKGTLDISIGKNVYFVGRGKVSTHISSTAPTAGLFEAEILHFNLDAPEYYDIRNNNGTAGAMFVGGNQSTFNTNNSTISFWKNTANLDGNASHFWKDTTFSFSGTNLSTLKNTTISEMNDVFTATNPLTNYARISANNQLGQIDALRIPTDADKYIYTHASFPEGKFDEPRDAMADEVKVTVGIYDPQQTEVKQVAGNTQGMLSIYGEAESAGWTKIPYDELLPSGFHLKVLAAQLLDENNQPTISLPAEDLQAESQTVVDVTPPDPVKTTSSVVAPNAKTISGTGEPDTELFFQINGTDIGEAISINAEGKFDFQLPSTITLKIGDKIQIFAKDRAGKASISNPPPTNDDFGNIEPSEVADFHDTQFAAATILTVDGVLSFVSAPNILFGNQSISTKTQIYRPETIEGSLVISDTRGSDKGDVRLYLQEVEPLTNDELQLNEGLSYTNQAGKTQLVSPQGILVDEFSAVEKFIPSDEWNKESGSQARGFSLTVPVEKQKIGSYEGTVEWSLQTVPANN